MQKIEAKCQTKFNHWVKNVFKKTAAFELKQTQTDSIPFSDVKPHQVDALMAVREGVFVWKIPDSGFQNPYDSFCMVNEQAYVVIFFKKSFEMIPITGFVLERERSKRKSLTYERAKEISTISVPLK
jgi:penicillin-binding protein-related factor A (putative recombinase)